MAAGSKQNVFATTQLGFSLAKFIGSSVYLPWDGKVFQDFSLMLFSLPLRNMPV